MFEGMSKCKMCELHASIATVGSKVIMHTSVDSHVDNYIKISTPNCYVHYITYYIYIFICILYIEVATILYAMFCILQAEVDVLSSIEASGASGSSRLCECPHRCKVKDLFACLCACVCMYGCVHVLVCS